MPDEIDYEDETTLPKPPKPKEWGAWAGPDGQPIPAEYWIPPTASFGDDPSGMINRQNPYADPGQPFAQVGTSGGALMRPDGSSYETIGAGRSTTPEDYRRMRAEAVAQYGEDRVAAFEKENPWDVPRIGSAMAGEGGNGLQDGGGYQAGKQGDITSSWLDYIKQRDSQVAAERAGQRQKMDYLWSTYKTRSEQALTGDDPTVRPQVDAYRANETRSMRDYLADEAERAGPYSNQRGERRLGAERVGQRTATFEAEIRARTLQSQRDQIAQSLNSMSGMLDADMQREMIEQLHLLDAAIAQQHVGLGQQGLDQDWQKALLSNNQFTQQLGLTAEDRSSYWDAVRRGLI